MDSKPFSLVRYLSEDMTASGASAVDIWGCYSDNASLAITDAGTDCYLVAALSGDLDAGGTQVTHVFSSPTGWWNIYTGCKLNNLELRFITSLASLYL